MSAGTAYIIPYIGKLIKKGGRVMAKVISLDNYRAKKVQLELWIYFWTIVANQNDDGPLIA